jgi:4-hydroxyphenylpyruvate dioxygenase
MPVPRDKRIMWLSNVRAVPFRERLEATGRAGFGWISTSPDDYDRVRASGLTDRDMRSIASDNGVRLSYLDPLTSWVPDGLPEDEDASVVAYLRRTPDAFFRIAEALEVDRIHLIGSFPVGRYTIAELTQHYAAICDRAAQQGWKCLIEAMPLWGLRTVDEAWAIVKGAGRKNSGIIFDTWHYVRGGRNDALLREIPPGVFDTVQIADATLACPPGRTMLRDTLFHRLPIGQGELPNLEILKILEEAGHIASVGPEIFSEELDRLSGDRIMATIMPGFEDLLARLGAGRGLALG